jgi:glycosyltransferase involved in cell wall biosynthesis
MSKILITTGIFPPDIGGPASYSVLLAEELSKKTSVEIVTYSSKFGFAQDKTFPFKVSRVWRGWPKFLRHFLFFLKIYAKSGRADKIYALNAVSAGLPSFWVAKMRGKKFFVRIAGDYAWEIAAGKGKTNLIIDDFQKSKRRGWARILHWAQTKVCKNADLVIVPSNYLAGIVKDWGVDRNKIKVIYNGVDFHTSELGREEARKKIGIPGNIIISIGRLVPWKGFRMLIKIMPSLLGLNQFLRLVIAGDGPEKKILEMIVKNMCLENKVYIVGKKTKEELAIYLAAADIFMLNTGYEGFSHQILEAMSAGVPVITTNSGGNKEIIKQGINGFMVKYNDEFNLIEAVKTLWHDKELQASFVENGKVTVADFNHTKMLEETTRVLNSDI